MFDLNKEWSISFAGCGFMGIYYVGAASCISERLPLFFQKASRIYGASAGSLMSTIMTVGIPLEWSISFAGCGFMGIYYVGAVSCISERLPQLFQGAVKIYGASSGALIAAVLTNGISLGEWKRKLGPLHPAFNLLQIVRRSMVEMLPPDAHLRASGKLCVSLTRVADGKNVIVSEFDTRDELIQVLICSCFIPFYCGIIPPTYRGVRYVDGAISDNLPRCHQRNTITFSAFAGESDVCPRGDAALSLHEVRFNNVSIHVNAQNMYRVTSTFFPPEPEIMAEICDSGYLDALCFLQENGSSPPPPLLSVYYLGALSCILDHAPHLVQRASKFCGASSGCLIAASLAVGIPIEACCELVLSTALAARRHQLSVLHPAFSLLRAVQDSLLRHLPRDAHLCASGRLCVSLTRLCDGENVLVTEFDSREELIQGYMDGALSNNIPLFDQRNTITVSPFSGEADICPMEGGLAVLAVHYGNLGIQKLAEMSHHGYMDALRFLRGNGEIHVSLQLPVHCVCSGTHWWLGQEVAQTLPASIQKGKKKPALFL
ncbi:hypothetical protein CRUP_031117 [Coryphaenoides rupestris]|nr:hypothetical protein CRUP_031117 [Coryphaenoides rupestris]